MIRQKEHWDDYRWVEQRERELAYRQQMRRQNQRALTHAIECIVVFLVILIAWPLMLIVNVVRWAFGFESLWEKWHRNYGDIIYPPLVLSLLACAVALIGGSIVYYHSTQTFCERHSSNKTCQIQEIDREIAQLQHQRATISDQP